MTQGKDLCENCKASYERKTRWQKYCSDRCRLEAWVLKRVEVKVSFKSHKSTSTV
jgi:hypothetical protein